jgi:hypothetical protein
MGGAPRIIGHTPLEAGAHYDQPAIMLEYFDLMDSYANRVMSEQVSRK